MGAVVEFNYAAWVAMFPEFANVSELAATAYFAQATAYHSNLSNGVVNDAAVQALALNLVTAHIAARYSTPAGGAQPSNTPVGRISSASEGSVSVSTEMSYPPGSASWWNQTKYGADYWALMTPYRTARYRPLYTRTGGVPPYP